MSPDERHSRREKDQNNERGEPVPDAGPGGRESRASTSRLPSRPWRGAAWMSRVCSCWALAILHRITALPGRRITSWWAGICNTQLTAKSPHRNSCQRRFGKTVGCSGIGNPDNRIRQVEFLFARWCQLLVDSQSRCGDDANRTTQILGSVKLNLLLFRPRPIVETDLAAILKIRPQNNNWPESTSS